MARVRVVLNRPESASNVGAVARVISNTGLSGLDLVQPCDFRTVEAWRMAWRSEDVLEQVRVFDSLEAARADAAYVAGFAGREGRKVDPITPRQMAAEIAALDAGAGAAIVFGCESRGLTEEELGLCQRRVRIPSHPRQASLNLAQAVMVAAYEILRRLGRAAGESPRAGHRGRGGPRARSVPGRSPRDRFSSRRPSRVAVRRVARALRSGGAQRSGNEGAPRPRAAHPERRKDG